MHIAEHAAPSASTSAMPAAQDRAASDNHSTLMHYQIIRRNGAVVPFEPAKIAVAMMKAFLAVHGTQGAASASVREMVEALTQGVVRALMRSRPGGGTFHIEDVQDQVELGLMRSSNHEVARAYVLYRERRTQERAQQQQVAAETTSDEPALHVIDGGQCVKLSVLIPAQNEAGSIGETLEQLLNGALTAAEAEAEKVTKEQMKAAALRYKELKKLIQEQEGGNKEGGGAGAAE